MKNYSFLAALFFAITGWSQQSPGGAKGAMVITEPALQPVAKNTFAVVVGISDYQDPAIPDLRFADKDAEAFAEFLRSDAGGRLTKDHLKVLLNKDATMAQFAIALDWLWEKVKEGDQAIIFFSGHGDVEKKSLTQPGFLLCWDAPARVYMAGGAFALPMLQEVISTLSTQNKAKVVVVMDACHSGALAGSAVSGAQATTSNLSKQFANEIKILSCQPNEYSIEGEQWGGGRGAFSYNLVNALYGMADNNKDLFVTLQEIGRYLEDHVPSEVAPISQMPMVLGNRSERITAVDNLALESFKAGKSVSPPKLSTIASRGFEADILADLSAINREYYQLFNQALANKQFLEPADACADYYYQQLVTEPTLSQLHTTMQRNYAAALQDDAQQVINKWLKTGLDQIVETGDGEKQGQLTRKDFTKKVRTFPSCLALAAQLLGKNHYMYEVLQARRHFFEGYLIANANLYPNPRLGYKALEHFRQALQWQPDQPQVYLQMSKVFGYKLLQPDSMEIYAQKAMASNPNWIEPPIEIAFILSEKYNFHQKVKPYLEHAMAIDSTAPAVWNQWGVYYDNLGDYANATIHYQKAVAFNDSVAQFHNNLGNIYVKLGQYDRAVERYLHAIALDTAVAQFYNNLGNVYLDENKFALAEAAYRQALVIDSTDASAYDNLGNIYSKRSQFREAEKMYQTAIALDSNFAAPFNGLGYVSLKVGDFSNAERLFRAAIQLDSTNATAYGHLGFTYLKTGRFAEAELLYQKAIRGDSTAASYYLSLGKIYQETNRLTEAEAYLDKAIRLDSTIAQMHINLGSMYLKSNRYDLAEVRYRRAVALDSANFAAHAGLGNVLLRTGQFPLAELQFKQALLLDSVNANIHGNLGYLYVKTGQLLAAEHHFRRALSIDSTNVGFVSNLGELLLAEGRYLEAEDLFKKAIAIDNTNAALHYDLSRLLSVQGQLEAGYDYLRQALDNGYRNFEQLQSETDFDLLRERLQQWDDLMKKYFPEKIKH